uniref:Uncharacterized protein n=1 Tax=Arundo donax TaxID=35708 RepID=A0A0A9DA16_ARUDO
MFIPMASPVLQLNLMYRFLPAIAHCTPCSLANLLDLLKTMESVSKLAGSSRNALSPAARRAVGRRATGARVMPSRSTTLVAPPDSAMALQPRLVLATRHPSVVAMGT